MTVDIITRNRNRRYELARTRGGFTFVEMLATMVLLGMLFTLSVSILIAAARQRRLAEQHQFALQHGANLIEHATTRPWSALSPGPQELPPAPDELQSILPGLERSLEVTQPSKDSAAKQIIVAVRWKSPQGQVIAPVRLAAWVYPLEATP
jgi:prepilin-type N-terminal cleavage/methylation domain-containing protein